MEDQRNWTDASYKIYSTPLSRPRPVEILSGTQVGQSITLTLQGKLEAEVATIQLTNKSPFQPTLITIGESTGAVLPSIGLSVPDLQEQWSNQTIELLRQLHLSHLCVTLHLFEPGYAISFAHAVNGTGVLGVPLEVALIVSNYAETELAQFVAALPSIQPDVCRWLVFHRDERTPDERWLRLARKHLAKWKPHIRVGSGTLMNFAELNRARLATDQLDSIVYAINPQVHASDHTSLMETLEGQRETIRVAQKIAAGLPLVIGPIELKRYRRHHSGSITLSEYDTRQLSLFGASWILGSLANACLYSHVQSVTFCDAIGWQGVILNGDEKALHPEFPIAEGQTFPLYYVLLTVGSYKTGKLVATRSSKPAVLTGMAIQNEGRLCILLANLTSEVQHAVIRNMPERVQLTCLDETSMADTTTWHTLGVENNSGLLTIVNGVLDINCLPYAVVRIEYVNHEVISDRYMSDLGY